MGYSTVSVICKAASQQYAIKFLVSQVTHRFSTTQGIVTHNPQIIQESTAFILFWLIYTHTTNSYHFLQNNQVSILECPSSPHDTAGEQGLKQG